MKRNLTPSQLNYLAKKRWWTKVRLNAWRTMPEKMEAIRKQATAVAKTVKDEKNDRIREAMSAWPSTMTTSQLRGIREAMSAWPSTMTTSQLREHILKDFTYDGKVSSLIWRMRRHGMMEFKVDGLWHNLCHLPAE